MNFTVTLSLTGVGLGLTLLFGWLGARPPDFKRGPRLLPYRFLMLLAGAWTLLMLVHLANLAGLDTGR